MNTAPVIFVHSSFRTGSTYIRSCFRKNPNALTYQEIFNENLATMQPEDIGSFNSENWHSKHPAIAPYFLEFHSLLEASGGVRAYESSMSYDTFFPADETLTDAEIDYVDSLIRHAREQGRIPVLTDTRSLGRLAALKKQFGGLHLLLYRNIFHQWCSYTEQWLHGNPTFIETVWLTLKGAHREKIASDIAGAFASGNFSALDPKNFFAFVLLHIYLYARAGDAATSIIDIDELDSNPDVRASLEDTIRSYSGLEVDFSGVRQSLAYSLVDIGSERLLSDTINAFPEIQACASTPDGAGFVSKVITDLVAEHRNYRRYAGSLVKLEKKRTAELVDRQSEVGALQRELEGLRAEVATQRLAIESQHARLVVERGEMESVRTQLVAQQVQIDHQQQEVEKQHKERVVQHDTLADATENIVRMRQSTCWRITAPLRFTKGVFSGFLKQGK